MTDVQKLEIDRYRSEITDNVQKLVDKYLQISGWDIPEIDEKKTMGYILQVFRETLDGIEKDWKAHNSP